MSNYPLEFKNVLFTYDRSVKLNKILDNTSFAINPGQITGLLGANGIGKSTLLKCAIGLLYPDGGSINQFGVPIKKLSQKERSLFGYDAVSIDFPSHLMVREVIEYVKSTYVTWDHDLEKKLIDHYFKFIQFDQISNLSTGAIRKLGLMCAVCHKPKLILLDESLSGLDIESRLFFIDLLGELASEGASVIYATHILPDIERISDNVLVLKDGKIQIIESVETIPENYFFVEENNVHNVLGEKLKKYQNKFLIQSNTKEMTTWKNQDIENNNYITANLESLYLSMVHGEDIETIHQNQE